MEFKDNDKPIFIQIADRICDEILAGIHKEQERLPSVRELASALEVNPNTVVRSFEVLESYKITYNKRGIGFYVQDGAIKTIRDMRKQYFVDEMLPKFFKEIDLLGIDISDIEKLYFKSKGIISTLLVLLITSLATISSVAQKVVTTYKIFDEINSTAWVHTQGAFEAADADNADCIIIHMNTYGGEVVYADSIRTKILNSAKPVYVFIDNNAASAGSLISIACDSIYMRKGANIGAASVVNQSGEKMPDKYQSYMRSTMRSTAEAHGFRAGDSTRWLRDPHIAEAMVDEFVHIEGVVDSGKILTFTADEAITNGFCEGKMNSLEEVAHHVAGNNCIIKPYEPSTADDIKGFLSSTTLRGILVLIIIGGIYFELQTPGVGFPLCASIAAAVLYFAPLYVDGLAANWEILVFLAGVALLAVEIFVIPGFGVTGVLGIICIVMGLSFSLLDNDGLDFSNVDGNDLLFAISMVSIAIMVATIGCLAAGHWFFKGERGKKSVLVLGTDQEGYVGTDTTANDLIGHEGTATTDLRPSGKINIDGKTLDAMSDGQFIAKGSKVIVVSATESQAVVTLKA